MHPGFIEVEHYGIGAFVGVGYIGHKGRIDGITPVRPGRVVKVDYIESRYLFIPVLVVQKVVIGYLAQVGKFEVVHVHGKSLFNLLFDELVYDGETLAAARYAQNDGRSLRRYD